MKLRITVAAFAALFLLHQDCWNWDNRTLVFGFLPAGLAYHALFSLTAATFWYGVTRFAWPSSVERWAEGAPAEH